MKYIFDIEYVRDHDSLKAGRIADGIVRMAVEAEHENRALLDALHTVGATHGMVTSHELIAARQSSAYTAQ